MPYCFFVVTAISIAYILLYLAQLCTSTSRRRVKDSDESLNTSHDSKRSITPPAVEKEHADEDWNPNLFIESIASNMLLTFLIVRIAPSTAQEIPELIVCCPSMTQANVLTGAIGNLLMDPLQVDSVLKYVYTMCAYVAVVSLASVGLTMCGLRI